MPSPKPNHGQFIIADSQMKNVRSHLKNQQTQHIRQPVHVDDGEDRPAPAAGFSFDDGDGAHALYGQHEPDQQADRHELEGIAALRLRGQISQHPSD